MVCIVPSKPRREICAFVTGSRRTVPASTLGATVAGGGHCNTCVASAGLLPPANSDSLAQFHLARREQITHPTSQRPAQLAQRLERRVLAGVLQPVQSGLTDPEPLRHLGLTQSRRLPHPS